MRESEPRRSVRRKTSTDLAAQDEEMKENTHLKVVENTAKKGLKLIFI